MFFSRLASNFLFKLFIVCIALALLAGFTIANTQMQDEQREPQEKKRYGIFSIVFSPDGSTLAAGTGNNVIVFWNPQSGELKRILKESVKLPTRTR
jgi:WD40 repeat protein